MAEHCSVDMLAKLISKSLQYSPSNEYLRVHNIDSVCIILIWREEDFDSICRSASGKCNIELTMAKHWNSQIKTYWELIVPEPC